MLTSNTELVGESAASALTLVGKKKFVCNQNHSCCTPCSRACAALAASPGVWRKDCPEPGWAGVGGSQCGCLQWESWEDGNSSFLIGNMKAVGFSCRIPWKYEMILAGGFSSTAAVVGHAVRNRAKAGDGHLTHLGVTAGKSLFCRGKTNLGHILAPWS